MFTDQILEGSWGFYNGPSIKERDSIRNYTHRIYVKFLSFVEIRVDRIIFFFHVGQYVSESHWHLIVKQNEKKVEELS